MFRQALRATVSTSWRRAGGAIPLRDRLFLTRFSAPSREYPHDDGLVFLACRRKGRNFSGGQISLDKCNVTAVKKGPSVSLVDSTFMRARYGLRRREIMSGRKRVVRLAGWAVTVMGVVGFVALQAVAEQPSHGFHHPPGVHKPHKPHPVLNPPPSGHKPHKPHPELNPPPSGHKPHKPHPELNPPPSGHKPHKPHAAHKPHPSLNPFAP